MRELLEKILQVDEFDVKRAARTAVAAGLIAAGPAILGYQKGAAQKGVEKPEIAPKVEMPAPTKEEEPSVWQTINMRVTAYCPCPECTGEDSPGVTASGHKIQPDDVFVAADKRYSFGTEMVIPGYNDDQPVKVLDRGGAIKGDRIDVFFPTHDEALEWGVQNLDVEVQSK